MAGDALESLRRAESQREVLLCLVEHGKPMSSQEIAKRLSMTVNAVNIALHNLHNKGLVERVARGVYRYKLEAILGPILRAYLERRA